MIYRRNMRYRDGVLTEEVTDISEYWQDDFVAFIIGCSFSFESEMIDAGIEIRHNAEGRNVPMYMTGIDCVPAGKFSGKMVVSMRPINPKLAITHAPGYMLVLDVKNVDLKE